MIPEAELKVETLRRDQRGGQHVGVEPSDVKVTHLPTGISATVGCCRSQYRNRNIAIEMIELALNHSDFGR